ncbi:oligosaccharide flippase family protein [Shimia sp. SDUM112013]|uniref:oligosaccharide flippase family protein n=1 Tax=Shimia sp. SDUM112013 TaxID=3136160 RepID=UPI0032EE6B92
MTDTPAKPSLWRRFTHGENLGARAARSSMFTILGYGGGQFLRLLSNLILTRLLYPEAFGLLSLVWVFMVGLQNFSDIGIATSIQQNKNGDEPAFLDTAWTLQVARGVVLWGLTIVLANPVAAFYDAPDLAELLPVVGLTLLIAGFFPMRKESANRHLMLGRVTALDLVAQAIGLCVGVVIAWATGSIWALVFSALSVSLMQLVLYMLFLPGRPSRFGFDKPSASEIAKFGSWIFFSTIAGFIFSQGDKLVLGKYLSLHALGIYNIGFFWASFPLMLGGMVVWKVLIPVYRERPPSESNANFLALRKLRFALTSALFAMLCILAFGGALLVDILYDERYLLSGGVLVLIALVQIPQVIVLTYDQSAIASGDARRFFILAATRAAFMVAGLLVGVQFAGLAGALVGQAVAMILVYPVTVWMARSQGSWDPLHDGIFAGVGVLCSATALYLNFDAISALAALNLP